MSNNKISFFPRLICFMVLLVLIAFHIIPIPILETLGLYIVLNRPGWFKKLIDRIYSEESIGKPEDLEFDGEE